MAEVKRVTLHPIYDDGSINRNINIYPKTLIDGIVDRDEKPVDILGLIDEEKQRAIGREDEIEDNSGNHLEIDQDEQTGIVTIKLLNIHDEVLDTKTLDLETEKIIKTVDLDYEHKKLIFTLVDGTTIECDISQMIDDFNQKIIDEHDRAVAEETALNERIDDLDLEQVGSDGSYLKYVSQQDGQVSAYSQAFDTVVPVNNPSSINAPTTESVRNAIKDLDYSQVGQNGNYIKYVSETDGVISATLQPFDTTLTGATDNNAPTSKTVKDYADAIEADIHSKVVHKGTQDEPSDETIWGTKTFKSEQSFENNIDLNNSDIKNVNWLGASYATIDELSVKDGSNFKLGIGQDNVPYLYTTGNLTDGSNSTTIENIVTKTGEQVISGKKTFNDLHTNKSGIQIHLERGGIPYTAGIYGVDNSGIRISEGYESIQFYSNTFAPSSEWYNINLGSSNSRWHDLYLKGDLKDGTNSISVAEIGSKAEIQAEAETRAAADTTINTRIDNLDLSTVGENGYYIKTVGQTDGQIAVTKQIFDKTLTEATDNNVPTSKTVKDYADAIDNRAVHLGSSAAPSVETVYGSKTWNGDQTFNDDIISNNKDIKGVNYIDTTYFDADSLIAGEVKVASNTFTVTNDGTTTYVYTPGAFTNGTESFTIKNVRDHIDATNNPHSVTKAQVGLGDVINTGDSATPVENGTTKFTTGGAYTLKTTLESADTTLQNNINTVDDKLNYNVHIEGSSDEITYNGDTVTKTSPYKNLKTGTTGSRSEVIHLANSTTAGMMSHTDYNTIVDLVDRVSSLEGTSVRITYSDSSTPTAAQIKDAATAYLATRGIINPTDNDYNGVSVRVVANNHLWNYYANLGTYRDDGLDTVSIFTNSISGIIKGKQADGFVYAENDGTGSIYGWSDLKTRMSNAENTLDSSLVNVAYDSTNKKLTKTTNAGTQTDIVNLGLNTATGSESITVGNNSLNIFTKDTAQDISGTKTFAADTLRITDIKSSGGILMLEQRGDNSNGFYFNGSIEPKRNNNYDIGSSSKLVKDFYLYGNLKDSNSNSVSVANITSHIASTNNPHQVTAAQIGLGNVDNTSDANKPISTATQAALDLKANDSEVVHLAEAETITGLKTFSNGILINGATLSQVSTGFLRVAGLFLETGTHRPMDNNGSNLGQPNYKWKNLYLAGDLSDGTNSITIAHIEDNQNKVTSISDSSTDIEYPSAKCVYDSFDSFRTEINAKVLSYNETLDVLTSIIIPEGSSVENNVATFPEGVTVSDHGINL